jgi:uncharacterized membrane protein HdeD (DUF308 family)
MGVPMRDWLKTTLWAAAGSLALAILLIAFVVFAPLLLGGEGGGPVSALKSLIPVAAMLLIILFGLLLFAAWIVSLAEILSSKNSDNWKLMWAMVALALGIAGTLLYLYYGRKQRKA